MSGKLVVCSLLPCRGIFKSAALKTLCVSSRKSHWLAFEPEGAFLSSSAEGISCSRCVCMKPSGWTEGAKTAASSADGVRKCHAHYGANTLHNAFILTRRHRRTHHTHTQMKRRIVWEPLSSAVSQGLPVVGSLGALVLSSCQELWLRGELCVWPDNFALQTLNLEADYVCVCVYMRPCSLFECIMLLVDPLLPFAVLKSPAACGHCGFMACHNIPRNSLLISLFCCPKSRTGGQ